MTDAVPNAYPDRDLIVAADTQRIAMAIDIVNRKKADPCA